MEKRGKNDQWLQEFITKNPNAKEKFLHFAKRTQDINLLDKLYAMFNDISVYTNVINGLQRYKESQNPRKKEEELSKVERKFIELHWDPFLSQLVKNQINLMRN